MAPEVQITTLDISKADDGEWHLTQAVTVLGWGRLTEAAFDKLKEDCGQKCRPPVQGATIWQDGADVRVTLSAVIESEAEANSEPTRRQFNGSSEAVAEFLRKAVAVRF